MPSHEIPNAFLIRALARGPAHTCGGCGARIFVPRASGLCPYCAAGRATVVPAPMPRANDDLPFAPRLAAANVRVGRLRAWWRARRAARGLALPSGGAHPQTS